MEFLFSSHINQSETSCINLYTVSGEFPDSLKLANASPVYKAKDPLTKLIIDLLVFYLFLSKTFERLMFDGFSQNEKKTLSKLVCGFTQASRT